MESQVGVASRHDHDIEHEFRDDYDESTNHHSSIIAPSSDDERRPHKEGRANRVEEVRENTGIEPRPESPSETGDGPTHGKRSGLM